MMNWKNSFLEQRGEEMPKEYTYDLTDITTGKVVAQDITRVEMMLIVGKNINLGPCIRSGCILNDQYRVSVRREFERLNSKEYELLAEIELECREHFRGRTWSKTDGFDLASAWRRWKKQQERQADGLDGDIAET